MGYDSRQQKKFLMSLGILVGGGFVLRRALQNHYETGHPGIPASSQRNIAEFVISFGTSWYLANKLPDKLV